MSKVSIKGADTGTGVFTIESPATNTDRVLTLPDEAGTVKVTDGLPVADSWQLTADTNQGTDADVASNWARLTGAPFGSLGSALTESSGVFSFPSTGTYLISFTMYANIDNGDSAAVFKLEFTQDNSTYSEYARVAAGNNGSSDINATASNQVIVNVTDTSLDKFKFVTASFNAGTKLSGFTGIMRTGFTCIKL